jgi:hypothetical protein
MMSSQFREHSDGEFCSPLMQDIHCLPGRQQGANNPRKTLGPIGAFSVFLLVSIRTFGYLPILEHLHRL